MQQTSIPHKNFWRWRTAFIALILLAFALRIHQWLTLQFHRDEFYSMLAIQMITQKGVPVLPSGMFYEHGILFSYLSAGFVKLAGFIPETTRWVSVLAGTLAVASLWAVGRRMFRSPWVGLIAALALAFDVQSVIWSGRTRMLILAQMLVPWVVYGVWWSVQPGKRIRHRLAVVGGYLLLLLSHLSAIVLLPGLVAGWVALMFTAAGSTVRQSLRRYLPWKEILALLIAVGVAVGLGAFGQLPSSARSAGSGYPEWLRVLMPGGGFVANPIAARPAPFLQFWVIWPAMIFWAFAAVGLIALLWRWRQKRYPAPDRAWIFLLAVLGGMMVVWSLLIDVQWQRARYLVALVFPLVYWLGAQGMVSGAQCFPHRQRKVWLGGTALLVAGIFSPLLRPLVAPIGPGHLRYDLASAYVQDNWKNGDRIMSEHPAATYLYLHQNDSYLAPDRDLVLNINGTLVDRYTGGELVATSDDFVRQLNRPGRLWLISGENRLLRNVPPNMLQQILWQMDKVYYSYGVWALVSRGDSWPLANAPTVAVDYLFEDGTVLRGYTVQTLNRQLVRLTLFWQPAADIGRWKVFSHLRDDNNQTVAQSDHWLYHQALTDAQWQKLRPETGLFRDGVQVFLPSDLSNGTYRLLIGFYNPDNWQRLGVENDQTGEAAVLLFALSIAENGVEVTPLP